MMKKIKKNSQLILPAVFLLFPLIMAAHFVWGGTTGNPAIFFGELGMFLVLCYALCNTVLMVFSLATYRRFTLALLCGRWVRQIN
jgi:hypothetical protein